MSVRIKSYINWAVQSLPFCFSISYSKKMSSCQDQLLKSSNDEQDFLLAMELVNSSIPQITMKAAIKLGVLEILAKASPSQLSSSEIASQLPTNNKEAPIVLDRILRLLACHSFLTCNLVTNKDGSVQRLYGLASASRFFVPNEDGVSLAPCLFLTQDKVFMETWYFFLFLTSLIYINYIHTLSHSHLHTHAHNIFLFTSSFVKHN